MAIGRSDVARQLQALFSLGTASALSDGELLDRFATRRGPAAEAAFAALVERHGPVVLRVCRDILRDPDDAEDAFQATFLVLVRRAHSIRRRDSVASWLYGVALRVSARGRVSAMRRRAHERKAAERASGQAVAVEQNGDDLGPVLHEEVGRLPETYRAAVVLCYWQGLTHEQAAARLNWPVGTVRSRLAWARRRLRSRLIRRGLAPSVVVSVGERSASAMPVRGALIESTARGAVWFQAGQVPLGMISAPAMALTKGVIRTMRIGKWKMIGAGLAFTVGIVAAATGGLAQRERDPDPQAPETTAKEELPRTVLPHRTSYLESQIRALKNYALELEPQLIERKEAWIGLPARPNDEPTDTATGRDSQRWIDSENAYRTVREQLFRVRMSLIEIEALLESGQEEVPPPRSRQVRERPLKERLEEALRNNDPGIIALLSQIEWARQRLRRQPDEVRSPSRQDQEAKLAELLMHRAEAELFERLDPDRRNEERLAKSPRELRGEINAMKARKRAYERNLSMIEATQRKERGEDAMGSFFEADLTTLRGMLDTVKGRIEFLQYEAGGGRKR